MAPVQHGHERLINAFVHFFPARHVYQMQIVVFRQGIPTIDQRQIPG